MAGASRPRFVPVSTYRLQVHGGFPLTAAADVVPYLARLGVGVCYTAPYFTAGPGSTHGYDVCNHNEINPELGGDPAHRRFAEAIAAHELGHIVDFVPNHMGIGGGGNAWWRDVLENGPSSPAAKFFDIDWAPIKTELFAKLLLPILGDQYGQVLERGELRLEFRDGALVVRYFEHELPVNPRQAPRVYRRAVEPLTAALGADNPVVHEFLSIIASLENMPAYTEQSPDLVAERQREKEVARARLARLVAESPELERHIGEAIEAVNGTPGDPASFDALHALLEAQAYRLSYWRAASQEINYRRFFDVNTLAGLRVEEPEVFEATHALLARLLREDLVHGVRIDHPDGLFDPRKYFEMLQGLDRRTTDGEARPFYVVAEKILSGRERLSPSWAVHGTTGYDFLNALNGIFVDPGQARRLRRIYAKLTGQLAAFEDVLYDTKQLIMTTAMASELNVLAHMLDRIGESNRKSRDFTLESLRDVIREVVACFPVYRTYVDDSGWTAADRSVVEQAISRARRRNPAMEASLFDFFREVVLPRDPHDQSPQPPNVERRSGARYQPADADEIRARRLFAMKLQQYTGPVQAKGLEDTAFYRFNLLLSLNEVGGDPARIGRPLEDFHAANAYRAAEWPFDMLTTATHDTKLGEDVRARINIIAETPDDWGREAARWMRINRSHRRIVDGDPAPDRNDEYRLYQVLLGAWPIGLPASSSSAPREFIDRISAYMLKAVREAKVHTSWITTNAAYEEALTGFIERILGDAGGPKFLPAFVPFQQRVARLAVVNSLSQVVLKLGSPGVPDFYQGTELWDLSLVDPDNRRPVDFALRGALLESLDGADPAALLRSWADGRIKLLVTHRGLLERRAMPDVFVGGAYHPLVTETSVPGQAAAFARTAGSDAVLVVAPRLCAPLASGEQDFPLGGECWKTSRVLLPDNLRDRTFRDIFTGAQIRPVITAGQGWFFLGQAFETLPVAMLKTE